jgi:hypothetical protein
MMRPLPRDRPLWELLLVPRVEGSSCGVLFRVHHAVADGLRVESLIEALSDAEGPASAEADRPAEVAAQEQPRRSGMERLRTLTVETIAVFRRSVRSRVLLGPLGVTRDIALFETALTEVHAGALRRGATVNDAFLAAFGQGLRALLIASGESPPVELPVSCPVRLPRRQGEGNATGVMLVRVPVRSDDVLRAVSSVAAETRLQKVRARAAGTFGWMARPRSAALLMRFARHQRAVAALASDIAGPSRTLRIGGAELVRVWPLSLLSANVRVGALCVSYAGRLSVSVQTDAEHLPPARLVADAMEGALQEIASAPGVALGSDGS